MADMDIMPYDSSMGGHTRVVHYPLDGSASFLRGEVVVVDAGGQLNEAATQPDIGTAAGTAPGAVGIAAESAQGIADSQSKLGTIASAANIPAAVYPFNLDSRFVTRNMYNGSDTATAFTVTNIGDTASLRLTAGGVWGIDIGTAAGAENFLIEGLLDANGQDAVRLGTTAVAAIFRLIHYGA